MANTGTKIVLTLKEVAQPAGTATGNTKNNVSTDANYIAPYQDLQDCSITFAMVCPVVIFTRLGTTLEYEFHLPNEVAKNPAVTKVIVETSVSPGTFFHTYTIPNSPSENFISNKFIGLTSSTNYDIVIKYYNASDALLHTCTIDA